MTAAPNLFTGNEQALQGMQRASDKADKLYPNWTDSTYKLFLEYIKQVDEFMTEDFRMWLNGKINIPEESRAFGTIIKRAVKENYILFSRYGKSNNPNAHARPTGIWKTIKY